MSELRVLLPIHDFLPAARAGSELYTLYLARELHASGVPVQLFFAENDVSRSVEHRTYEDLPCTVLRKPWRTYLNLFRETDSWVNEAFLDCLARFRPTILHVNHLLQLSIDLPRLAHQRGIPVVFTLHDYWLRCPRIFLLDRSEQRCERASALKCTRCCFNLYSRARPYPRPGPRRALRDHVKSAVKLVMRGTNVEMLPAYLRLLRRGRRMRTLFGQVDRWIAPSQFLQQMMIDWGIPRGKVLFLPYGMPKDLFDRASPRRIGSPLRFGYIGTLSRHKGLHVLLEAFRGMREAVLDIYGAPSSWLTDAYADVLAQDNVRLHGVITDEEKPNVLAALDALIVPSIWFENAPLTIHEAFLVGVPVICSDIGGMQELVRNGVDGVHFRVGSPEDLRRVVLACIADPQQLRTLRPTAERVMSSEEHVRRLVVLYRDLLREPTISALPKSYEPSGSCHHDDL
jgi:glycosyltransferase involved in cell wall biosynthesis